MVERGTGWLLRCEQGNRYVLGLDPEQVGYWLTHLPGHKVTLPAGERVTILEMESVSGWFAAEVYGKDRVIHGWVFSQISRDHVVLKLHKTKK